MINEMFCEDEYEWLYRAATALLIPFILNYIFTMACWMRSEEKIKTLIFPLLNIYPQFCEYTLNIFFFCQALSISQSLNLSLSLRDRADTIITLYPKKNILKSNSLISLGRLT